jgi:(p)ppGpp synthase/HD superfamily hydrolase
MKFTEAAFKALREKAIKLAMEKHIGQTYGQDKPYTWHLRHVADNVMKWAPFLPYGAPIEAIVVAAWLHDIIEDCGFTREEIEFHFGSEVAEIVWRVTDEEGANRKERHEKTYPKIRESVWSVFLKLMDRISNIEAGGKAGMYIKEFPGFKEALYKAGEFDPIWEHLETILKDAA